MTDLQIYNPEIGDGHMIVSLMPTNYSFALICDNDGGCSWTAYGVEGYDKALESATDHLKTHGATKTQTVRLQTFNGFYDAVIAPALSS